MFVNITSDIVAIRVYSYPRFIGRELLRERELFSPCNGEKWAHNPLLSFSVHTKVDQIASMNAHTSYSTTHYLPNSSCNSICPTNCKCEWILEMFLPVFHLAVSLQLVAQPSAFFRHDLSFSTQSTVEYGRCS